MYAPTQNARSATLPTYAAPSDGHLSAEMVAAYRDAGVLILEDFASEAACRALRAQALELVDGFDPAQAASVFSTTHKEHLDDRYFIESGDKIRFFLEQNAFDDAGALRASKADCLNKMGHALHELDPVFARFSRTPALAEIGRRLGLRDPGLIQSMYIFKPPRIGGEVLWHQDSTYLYTEPESCVGFWFAIEEATLDNGCMYFIPGGHRGPLRQRNYRTGPYSLQTDVLDRSPWPEARALPAPARVGTLVIFDGRTPHRSGVNHTSTSRHAYTLHAIERGCHYPADNWLQRPDMPLRGFEPS